MVRLKAAVVQLPRRRQEATPATGRQARQHEEEDEGEEEAASLMLEARTRNLKLDLKTTTTTTINHIFTLTYMAICCLAAVGATSPHLTTAAALVATGGRQHYPKNHELGPRASATYHQLTSQDLASADQLDDPTFISSSFASAMNEEKTSDNNDDGDYQFGSRSLRLPAPSSSSLLGNIKNDGPQASEPIQLDSFSEPSGVRAHRQRRNRNQHSNAFLSSSGDSNGDYENNSGEDASSPDSSGGREPSAAFMSDHNSNLRAMRDMFERRHSGGGGGGGAGQHQHSHHHQHQRHHPRAVNNPQLQPNSQELSPISIGLDPPFAMPPFQMGDGPGGAPSPHMPKMSDESGADSPGPALPFGLNPLPHLLGFQSSAFDGPQRGDQSAHSNHHAAAAPSADVESPAGGGGAGGPKVWPKIFRFTDGRINLSDFEKQKKIRLSNKNQHRENHIDSEPIMFDGRQLKRKSFLILHGGVFPS